MHILVHKTHYMILFFNEQGISFFTLQYINNHTFCTGSLRNMKNFKISTLLFLSQSYMQEYWLCLIFDLHKFIICSTLSEKYFKSFKANNL